MPTLAKLIPHLWFEKDADEAARLYVSLFPDSRIDSERVMAADTPSGPEGAVKIVEFTLMGQPLVAFTAGPFDKFNHAISFLVACEDQDEIDRYWEALGKDGKHEQCGWLKDKYGLHWQIAPRVLNEMMKDKDHARARRVTEAMLKMVKLDIAALKKAYDGK
ncbi:MAG: VOC family protein [Alphaproteobacteria bacterium]